MLKSAQRSLVKPLEPSSARRRLRRPEDSDALRFEIVGEPGDERRLGPHDYEADSFISAEGRDGRVVVHLEVHARGHLCDTRIAGRTIKRIEQGALGKLPGERMLASAATDQKHIHRALSLRPR